MIAIFSILITKIMVFVMRLLGGGSSMPGELILKLDKNILKKVSRGYKVILVTGTNGKTTTCSMLYNILKSAGYDCINNSSGANMTGGIVTCFAAGYKFFSDSNDKYAVIEVDEAYLRFITAKITPDIIIITNVFRDQVDRYGDTGITFSLIMEAVKNVPSSTLVLNGDQPLFSELELPNKCVYYGFSEYDNKQASLSTEAALCEKCQTPYSYNGVTFDNLGDYSCPNCGHSRPNLDFSVDGGVTLTPAQSIVRINDTPVTVGIPGLYNIYNALAAYCAARLAGVDSAVISASLENQKSKFGRFETIKIEKSTLKLLLIKNPAGCNQCIDTIALDNSPVDLMILLNNNPADGTDISWIYDAHFEAFATMNYQSIAIGGMRAHDMAKRLKAAGLDTSKFIMADTYDKLLETIKTRNNTIYACATYTAMTSFRKFLAGKGYVNSNW